MFTIQSNRLRVGIAQPNLPPDTTTRFDRAGFITEVILDGVHRFCATEPHNLSHLSSGGRGICNEYIFDPSAGVPVGDWFPKLGVGLLKKTSEKPYRFMERYQAQCFPVHIKQTENSATFETEPVECHNYSVAQTKTVTVNENELIIDVKLMNTGSLPIEGREYCHNFLTINGMALGPNYKLEFLDLEDFKPDTLSGILSADGKCIKLLPYITEASFAVIPPELFVSEAVSNKVFRWNMSNDAARARICVRDEIELCHLAIWAVDHIISVESFHKLSLKPGDISNWKRIWRFKSSLAGEGMHIA